MKVEIPSELIEPHLADYLSMVIESVGFGLTTPQEARLELKYVERFVNRSSGLHAKISTSNTFYKLTSLSDEEMIDICKNCIEK